MSTTIPSIRVGAPLCHGPLSVFPLFCELHGAADYRLSHEAMLEKTLEVTEVDEQGSVPDLFVENRGNSPVLFLEGEELVGAKQNRVLNTSVLVAAHSKLKIPVSCVEQGRWRFRSLHFGSSGSHSPSKLRRALKASVSKSVKDKLGHRSDQAAVWREVASLHAEHAVPSATAAMSDVFDNYQSQISQFREKLRYVDGARGLAVAIGEQVVSIDLFDKASTCEKVWQRMLSGLVLDAIATGDSKQAATASAVETLISTARSLTWHPAETVGAGQEYRAESDQGDQASVLTFERTIVHGSVIASAC